MSWFLVMIWCPGLFCCVLDHFVLPPSSPLHQSRSPFVCLPSMSPPPLAPALCTVGPSSETQMTWSRDFMKVGCWGLCKQAPYKFNHRIWPRIKFEDLILTNAFKKIKFRTVTLVFLQTRITLFISGKTLKQPNQPNAQEKTHQCSWLCNIRLCQPQRTEDLT